MVDPIALHDELTNDPNGYGYAALIALGADAGLEAMLNQVRPGISVYRDRIPTWEIIANTVKSEYDALPAGDKQLYQILVSAGTIDATDARIRQMFASIFQAGTTRTNLIAMAQRPGSRCEELFGPGTGVTHQQIGFALRG